MVIILVLLHVFKDCLWYDIRIKVSKLLSSRAVHFFVIICPILENPFSMIASDIGIKTSLDVEN